MPILQMRDLRQEATTSRLHGHDVARQNRRAAFLFCVPHALMEPSHQPCQKAPSFSPNRGGEWHSDRWDHWPASQEVLELGFHPGQPVPVGGALAFSLLLGVGRSCTGE